MAFSWQTTAVKGKAFPQAPEGSHPAVCVGLVELGTHTDVYKGKTKDAHRILILFELVNEMDEEGNPFILCREFNSSFVSGSNVRKFVEAWRGKKFGDDEPFDYLKLIDAKCILTIEHSKPNEEGKYYASINGIAPPMKGVTFGERSTTPLLWAFDMGTPYPNPEWVPRSYGKEISEIIAESKEARGYVGKASGKTTAPAPVAAAAGREPGSDDNPF